MQLTNLLPALATLAMTAAALPTADNAKANAVTARTDGGSGSGSSGCDNHQQAVCCNGILGCLVSLLGSNCAGSTYCCSTNDAPGTLIDINLLNCVFLR
ncbi:9ef70d6f-cade-4268-ac66-eeb11ad2aab3 [Thermothielavioides terrestris]|uniref:Hydrophobin n=2 Tax=Thermothielavioides terrestris TaxID=2587410 RepID=G2R5X2_THETT|nr:uncharacterized protein THITE_159967 [Thermothielavioides terrestris NRRL 8126]AEO68359.1 hypothetical protein THITE_159967 [Thermothielavioides terrestris NRRL 8126]SPQ24366.1 9ef70d6f-cade-4268-ac66-eeb11ad2aab3 [Thermothielavioides terrestris]